MPNLDNVTVARSFHEAWAQRIRIGELLLLQMIVNLSMFRGVKFSMAPKVIDMITKDGALHFQTEQWRLPMLSLRAIGLLLSTLTAVQILALCKLP